MNAVLIAIALLAVDQGLKFRHWLYATSGDLGLRFHGDIENAWRQGREVLDDAQGRVAPNAPVPLWALLDSYLNRYDDAMDERPEGDYTIDYPPARLLIMSVWAWKQNDIALSTHAPPEDLDGPLLNLNAGFELAGAVAAFLLVRLVLRRQNIAAANWIAMAGALLLWFDPALLIDAHVWPQWEAWVVPFYLFAAYFALKRWWLVCGLILGFGAMFKGQLMLVMAAFVLWPLFQMRFQAVLEVAAGILLGAMLYVWPWMLQTTIAEIFFGLCGLLAILGLWWIPRGWRKLWVCAIVGTGALISGLGFGGSFGWWFIGFEYGTRHYQVLTMGPVDNLASILESRFGWDLMDTAFIVDSRLFHIHSEIPVRVVLICLYVSAMLISVIGVALQDWRRDRRVLLALATPWVLLFAFMPQMHDRYLVWGAAITSLAVCVSLGTTLLHLVVTFLACLPLAYNIIGESRHSGAYPAWDRFLAQACNGTPCVTIFVALMLLYLSVAPSRKIIRPDSSLPARDPQ
jgi:hypothetical protein